jgi:hypothetical protein
MNPDNPISHTSTEHASAAAEYHFKEIKEIEEAMVSLVAQLKEAIDNDEYDTLLSDDAGGRIPTLVLRKIIRSRRPDHQIDTCFISAGRSLSAYDDSAVQEYLARLTSQTKKALVVSQLLYSGKTMFVLANKLYEAHIPHFDVAIVDSESQTPTYLEPLIEILGTNKLFIGRKGAPKSNMHNEHEQMGGIAKSNEPDSPIPMRRIDYITTYGREISAEEENEIFGVKKSDSQKEAYRKKEDPEAIQEYEERKFAPVTEEERKEMQKSIDLARADVRMLAERVCIAVWGNDKVKKKVSSYA